jgi:Fungal Zn(2)-Cys(6) binuclear cluster domain
MPVHWSPSGANGRKLRAHKKSRKGCGNCKLRSVKVGRPHLNAASSDPTQCDETEPACKRCAAYGVICNYNRASSELQLSVDGAVNIILPLTLTYWPSKTDQLLNKFQVRTALTVSTGDLLRTYQNEMVRLAASVRIHDSSSHSQCSYFVSSIRHYCTPSRR